MPCFPTSISLKSVIFLRGVKTDISMSRTGFVALVIASAAKPVVYSAPFHLQLADCQQRSLKHHQARGVDASGSESDSTIGPVLRYDRLLSRRAGAAYRSHRTNAGGSPRVA